MAADSPFFIVGSGRSGTTLLRLLLCSHSQIHIPPETWFVQPLAEQFSLTDALSFDDMQKAVRIITSHYRWADMQMDAAEFEQEVSALKSPKLVDILNVFYGRQLKIAGKNRFGDKTPPYIKIVPELVVLYPDAKFIHLIRDGRDVAISFIEAGFDDPGCRCYDGNRFEWTSAIRKGLSYRKSQYAPRLLEVRYEDLVADVEGTLRRICQFVEVPFEMQMLQRQPASDAVPARERHIHGKLDQPISSDFIATWRRKLSALECFVMEACLREDLQTLGYQLRFRSDLWRPLLAVSGAALFLASPFLDRALPYLRNRGLLPKTSLI